MLIVRSDAPSRAATTTHAKLSNLSMNQTRITFRSDVQVRFASKSRRRAARVGRPLWAYGEWPAHLATRWPVREVFWRQPHWVSHLGVLRPIFYLGALPRISPKPPANTLFANVLAGWEPIHLTLLCVWWTAKCPLRMGCLPIHAKPANYCGNDYQPFH